MRYSYFSIFAIIAILPDYVHSYCVYNDVSDATTISVDQVGNYKGPASARFQKYDMRPGQYFCCSFDNTACNSKGVQNDIVKFKFYRNVNDDYIAHWGTITVPADGKLIFRGTAKEPRFVVKWQDDIDYPYELEYSSRNKMFVGMNSTRNASSDKDSSSHHHGSDKKTKKDINSVDKRQIELNENLQYH